MNRLVVIDGNAILHRAFHAIPPLTDPDGNVVNAVYGFATMVMRIIAELKPTHMAVAFDRPAPTFRKEMYKDYQATRPQMDEGLVPQIAKVHDLVRAFGISIFEADGFEADDVIGTLCRRAGAERIDQVIIVTGDRDIMQLVNGDRVYVYMPVSGLKTSRLYGEEDVKDRIGVLPKNVVDLKGLAGDPSDNYPGVEGIGPKTAITLIEKYGSLEGVYRAIDRGSFSGPETVKEKLTLGRESAVLSKTLATIRTDAPVDVSIESMNLKPIDTPEAREYLEKLHFFSLLKRLVGDETPAVKPDKPKKTKQKDESAQQALF